MTTLVVIVALAAVWLVLSLHTLKNKRAGVRVVLQEIKPELLDQPVRLPPTAGYPDSWTGYQDATDVRLAALAVRVAALADVTWPHEEYLDVLDCPTPELTAYRTVADAHAAEGHRIITYDCGCGSIHVRPPRRRRAWLPKLSAVQWALTATVLAGVFGLVSFAAYLDRTGTPADHPIVTRTGSWPTAYTTIYPAPARTP